MYRPLCDGVFRAVPPAISAREYCGKVLQQVCGLQHSLYCTTAQFLLNSAASQGQ